MGISFGSKMAEKKKKKGNARIACAPKGSQTTQPQNRGSPNKNKKILSNEKNDPEN